MKRQNKYGKAAWTTAFPEQMQKSQKKEPVQKKRKRVPVMSKKRKEESPEYLKLKAELLAKNPLCAWGLAQIPPRKIKAVEIHHQRGRDAALYLDTRFFMGVCREGHEWIEVNRNKARETYVMYNGKFMALLCARGDWGRQS